MCRTMLALPFFAQSPSYIAEMKKLVRSSLDDYRKLSLHQMRPLNLVRRSFSITSRLLLFDVIRFRKFAVTFRCLQFEQSLKELEFKSSYSMRLKQRMKISQKTGLVFSNGCNSPVRISASGGRLTTSARAT